MQLLSKAPKKKEKHNNFFFKDTPESFVATSNSLKPFYKKTLKRMQCAHQCGEIGNTCSVQIVHTIGHLQICIFNLIYIYALGKNLKY